MQSVVSQFFYGRDINRARSVPTALDSAPSSDADEGEIWPVSRVGPVHAANGKEKQLSAFGFLYKIDS